MSAIDYTKMVPIPAIGDINTGYNALRVATLIDVYGNVFDDMPSDCGTPPDSISDQFIEANVGPFSVTGQRHAIVSLQAIFAEVKASKPDLYDILGTEGMLCWRHVRNRPDYPSNHAGGLAIDVKVGGILIEQGATEITKGLLDLYEHFRGHGWFWGAGYHGGTPSDSMHYEVANETVIAWKQAGYFDV